MVILVSLTCNAKAQFQDENILKSMDSVNVSLLTCGPGDEVYSLYGHTAVRFNDFGRGQDMVVNYGMFSFRQKYFTLRFVFGLTDYEMGITSYSDFIAEYKANSRWVKEQILNLNRQEKMAIAQAIDENYLPENKVYRYNFLYDNCTTRARDLITRCIDGSVSYAENPNITTSYRDMIHQWNGEHQWARFGNDLLLGVKADAKTNHAQQQFLPDNLRKDFAEAIIINQDGSRRPLVSKTKWLLTPENKPQTKESTPSPIACSVALLLIIILVCAVEKSTKRTFYIFDAVLLGANGLAGLVLFAMLFSQHPTVSLNFQIFILSPLSLFFAIPVAMKLRHHKLHWYVKVFCIMIISALILAVFQSYEPSVILMALSLLARYNYLIYTHRNRNKQ